MMTRPIKLTSLFLNTENYRFEPLPSQKDAIDKMVEDQGDKLYNLAKDIVANGLNPLDRIMVTQDGDPNRYVVLEGNRRVTALKLLNNPMLIVDKYSALRKKFQKLQKDYSDAILGLKHIECVISDTPTEANLWIKRKHSGELNGIGTVTWDSQQKQRFEENTGGKVSVSMQVIALLKSSEYVSPNMKEALQKLNITNLQRLLSDPYVRKQLGLEVNNGVLVSKVETSEVIKGLVKIVSDILDPQFKVSNIYTSENRKEYIDGIDKSQKPDLSKEISRSWEIRDYDKSSEFPEGGTEQKGEKPLAKKTKQRTTLIPKSVQLEIGNPKINKIFEELKKIPVRKYPNASSVMLRVFLELSVDVYLEKNNMVNNGALTACASKEDLQGKVKRVINRLEQKKEINADLSKGIRTEIKDKSSVLSIESLNAYVHSEFFHPKVDNLLIGWDNIEQFFVKLWESINKKG